jgi:hypothetical protein
MIVKRRHRRHRRPVSWISLHLGGDLRLPLLALVLSCGVIVYLGLREPPPDRPLQLMVDSSDDRE